MKNTITLFFCFAAAVLYGQSSSCDTTFVLDYSVYANQVAKNENIMFNGLAGGGGLLHVDEITSFVDTFHNYLSALAFQVFDSLVYVDDLNNLHYIPIGNKTITIDSLNIWMALNGDSTLMDADSLVFSIASVSGDTLTFLSTVVFDNSAGFLNGLVVPAGQGINISLPVNVQLPAGNGFEVQVNYLGKDTSTHFYLAYTWNDSCGADYAAYYATFPQWAGGYQIQPTGTGTATAVYYDNTYIYDASGIPETCLFVLEQNWYINPVLTYYTGSPLNAVGFSFSPPTPCPNTAITFSNQSSDTTGWSPSWNMGDGSTYNTVDETHSYSSGGTYAVTLSMDSAGCAYSFSQNVTVSTLPAPVISGNINTYGCSTAPDTISVSGVYNSYSWSNGSSSAQVIVDSTGTYTVTVTGNEGCSAVSLPYAITISTPIAVNVCIVSVDSAGTGNIIVWNNIQLPQIDSYFVYKETGLNEYTVIGGNPWATLSVFTDVDAQPSLESNSYYLGILDNCGNITPTVASNRTVHLSISQGEDSSLNLIWNAYQGFTFPTYYIYRGTSADSLQLIDSVSSADTTYSDLNSPAGLLYYQVALQNPNGCNPLRSTNYSVSVSNIVSALGVSISSVNAEQAIIYAYTIGNTNFIRVQLNNPATYTMNLYDMTGRKVMTTITDKSTIELLSGLAAGCYVAEVLSGDVATHLNVIVR